MDACWEQRGTGEEVREETGGALGRAFEEGSCGDAAVARDGVTDAESCLGEEQSSETDGVSVGGGGASPEAGRKKKRCAMRDEQAAKRRRIRRMTVRDGRDVSWTVRGRFGREWETGVCLGEAWRASREGEWREWQHPVKALIRDVVKWNLMLAEFDLSMRMQRRQAMESDAQRTTAAAWKAEAPERSFCC
jgi:hypothetical protein